ncbi:MAG: dihydroorotate dehydrogenase electron transfer subunit [Candidatus Omnitrophica bacterium]|nr:dihydroorotate dehydrogenase electron transfer subunit [Candidatus Omnitrophota bacterium]
MKKTERKKIIKGTISSNRAVRPDHFELTMEAPWLSKVSRAGQFVMVKLSDKFTDPLLRIPLAVHSKNAGGISLMYKVVGSGTKILSEQKKGTVLDVVGPLGNGFNDEPILKKKGRVAIIVAGGHGIIPLYLLAKGFREKNIEVKVFIGAGTKEHVLLEKKLKKTGASVQVATDNGTLGHKGSVVALAEEYLKKEKGEKAASRDIKHYTYACGPRVMLNALSKKLKKLNEPAEFSLDAYMACGIGACKGCAIKTVSGYKLVCKDGPVFDMRSIVF